jgi:hypothetical protein
VLTTAALVPGAPVTTVPKVMLGTTPNKPGTDQTKPVV